MKTCQKCGRELPLTDFHRNSTSTDGYCAVCKDCRRKYYYDQHGGLAHKFRNATTEEMERELARRRAAEARSAN